MKVLNIQAQLGTKVLRNLLVLYKLVWVLVELLVQNKRV
jgi:hypothetical protein